MTEAVIDRLNAKKLELESRLSNLYHGGSQRREALEYKIKKIEELITAYQSVPLPINLEEAKEILKQQVGFSGLKKRSLLEKLAQRNFLALCLFGPPGVGKSTCAPFLARALKREFFSINLGGLSDTSILLGTSENSLGTETGQLAKALIATKTHNPLILLDEIDKAGSSYKTAIHDCLLNVLDSAQNHEVLDHYLDVKLDFSRVIFVVTANDLTKIPPPLRDRLLIVKLNGYNIEQKKEIAQKIIQDWFSRHEQFNQDNFEIDSEALETLINKTNEEGVRQLKMALDDIFDYCLFQ
ncbi:24917_t:CDS:1 [Racocetra persica]|uniref:24917_t:CDS:1 n=1 Tax=Racocetra persica TaxID=160502 RepID=A0ACA9RJA8_9GLOM|nr:24917_t:CDS:1 [Racocetra persica]